MLTKTNTHTREQLFFVALQPWFKSVKSNELTWSDELDRISCFRDRLRFTSNTAELFVYEPVDGSNSSTNSLPMTPGPIWSFWKRNSTLKFNEILLSTISIDRPWMWERIVCRNNSSRLDYGSSRTCTRKDLPIHRGQQWTTMTPIGHGQHLQVVGIDRLK